MTHWAVSPIGLKICREGMIYVSTRVAYYLFLHYFKLIPI